MNNSSISFFPKNEVLIGGCVFLKNWIIRSETSDALDKLFIRNISTNFEEELIFSDEKVYVPNISLKQKDRNTDEIYLGYSSPKTPSRVYSYNLSDKSKKDFFYYVKKESITKLGKHWASQIGSFDKNHILNHKNKRFDIKEDDIETIQIEFITFDDLIQKYSFIIIIKVNCVSVCHTRYKIRNSSIFVFSQLLFSKKFSWI